MSDDAGSPTLPIVAGPLVVPVNLRALAITRLTEDSGLPTASLVGPSADFSNLPYYRADGTLNDSAPFLADSIIRYPDTTTELGVKLHWSLPAALRHGRRRGGTGPITFPAVPNRWLVTRIMTVNDDPAPRIKSWVLESDRLERQPQPGSGTIPHLETGRSGQFFRYLGRWSDYRTWREEPGATRFGDIEDDVPLTAVGYGDPLFAAYAPNCPNVFAFDDRFETTLTQEDRDAVAPLPEQPLAARYMLTYVVTGWYAGAIHDPLGAGSAIDVRKDFKWAWPALDEAPTRLVASGSVLNLPWNRTTVADIVPEPPAVAVGSSSAEALAALMARSADGTIVPGTEFMLNAIQAGAFKRLSGFPGWTNAMEADLHRKGFASVDGGGQWAVLDARDTAPGVDPATVAARAVPLPDGTATLLAALNTAQRAYDAARFEIGAAQRQLYADWYRRQMLTSVERGDVAPPWMVIAPDLTIASTDDLLRARMGLLRARLADLGDLSLDHGLSAADAPDLASRVANAAAAVVKALPSNWRLQRLPAPRFWRPADPVILLRGEAARPPARDGRADELGEDGSLPCRPFGLLPKADGGPGDRLRKIVGVDFARLDDAEKAIGDTAAALVLEAIVLSGDFDRHLADHGADFDPAAWRRAQDKVDPFGPPGPFGLPAPALARTSGDDRSWTPVLLAWTLRYRPITIVEKDGAATPIAPDVLTRDHRLDDAEVELLPSVAATGEPVEYRGWTALSSMATVDLAKALSQSVADGDAAGEAIARAIRAAPIMAQAAGGFHEALRMFEERPQLRVADPNEPRLPLAAQVGMLTDDQSTHAPFWDKPYAGFRSGDIELVDAMLIDVFGRRVRARTDTTVWSSSYRSGGRALLPARFAQPARLDLRWLAAANGAEEAGDHPESSPICGWVVPNLIAGALDVFAADGRALGSLKSGGGETLWHPAPVAGSVVEHEAGDAEAQRQAITADIADDELRALVLAIRFGDPDYLGRLLTAADIAIGRIIPADPGDMPIVLGGRALALVRARMKLELRGGAAADQGWRAMQATARAVAAGQPPVGESHGLASVKVAVHLGKTAVLSDGLVGFFDLDAPARYGMLFSAVGTPGMPDVVPAAPVAIAADDAPRTLALLIDPRAQLHATTGLLPVKQLSIPPATYAPALKRLAKTFFAGPLLFPPGARPMPLPAIAGHHWTWLRPQAGNWVGSAPDAASDDRAHSSYGPQRAEDGWLSLTEDRE